MGRASLIIVLGTVLIGSGLMWQVDQRSIWSTENAISTYERLMAYNIAQSGSQIGLRRLRDDPNWRAGYAGEPLFDGDFDVVLEDSSTDPSLDAFSLGLQTQGRFGSAAHDVHLDLFRPPFCYYLYFTHYEPEIYFITGDELDGPVHTNGTFHVTGSPTFLGRVTSPNPFSGPGSPELLSGANLAARAITLPTNLSDLEAAAAAGGLRLTHTHTWLQFLSDGRLKYASSSSGPWTTIWLSSLNGAIRGTRYVHVKGTVHGQVTVLSDYSMYIEDNIVLASDPRTNPASEDCLGLISKSNIYVTDNTANRTDCVIHAGLMALNTRFTAEDYSSGSPRGTLYILGSVVQQTRGAVGTFGSGGTIRTGYRKDYQYDDRFREISPPFFPRAVDFVLRGWSE